MPTTRRSNISLPANFALLAVLATLFAAPGPALGLDVGGPVVGPTAIEWTSSSPGRSGALTIAGPGGNSGGSAITVLPPVSSVSLSVSPDTLILPGTLAGIVTVRDAASTPLSGRLITFSSSNSGVVTVQTQSVLVATEKTPASALAPCSALVGEMA